MDIYGFTLLRNGIQYDYPFRESLRGLTELCAETYLALGKSEDGTETAMAEFPALKIVPTVWDESLRKSGLILSVQTNIALAALRRDHPRGWGFYLQADEVIDPVDFARIRADLAEAERTGCDAVSFRYLHFWQRYDHVAISRRCYPQEIRAIRLESEAESYGDAQSFRPTRKVFPSDATVYHYGHVRDAEAYARKRWDFGRWWHGDDELAKVLKKGERKEKREKVVTYLGRHPAYMRERMRLPEPGPRRDVLVYGRESDYSPAFRARVHANLRWTTRALDLLFHEPSSVVALEPLPFYVLALSLGRLRSRVPDRMDSPNARPWPRPFLAMLKFSEKGIPLR